MKWERLGSRKVFEHPRLTLFEDKVKLPNGLITSYIRIGEMPDTVMIIAVNKTGEILLQKEYSYPPDEVLLQLPGGLLDTNETPEQGAARELAEESGLAGDLEKIGWFFPDNRRKSIRMHVYIATTLREAVAKKDPEEIIEDYWFAPREIDRMIQTNEIRNFTVLAGWAFFVNHPLYKKLSN